MKPRSALAAAVALACAIATPPTAAATPFETTELATFDEPWAMTFLPDGRLLVTEKRGQLKLFARGGRIGEIDDVPAVDYGGQGGLGDVVLHPDFATNRFVYLSYAEAGERGTRGAAVARAKLDLDDDGGGRLEDIDVIWRQFPKKTGRGHYGHRIAFGDGHLWISSGERQEFEPAQDMKANLGKIVRLTYDGEAPKDNPFANQGGVTAQIWSLGHRNPLGIAFAADGTLWEHEMGPMGGDEFNRIERGSNYGYPIVSNGDHYDGRKIPDHIARPELNAPEITWNPVISPAGFVFYGGDAFPAWKGNALLGGLSSQALVRVAIDGTTAREVERYDMGQRIREIEQTPDGGVYVLEDGKSGRLLELVPVK